MEQSVPPKRPLLFPFRNKIAFESGDYTARPYIIHITPALLEETEKYLEQKHITFEAFILAHCREFIEEQKEQAKKQEEYLTFNDLRITDNPLDQTDDVFELERHALLNKKLCEKEKK